MTTDEHIRALREHELRLRTTGYHDEVAGSLGAVLDALEAARRDAERYRFIRDADRSDCITPELGLYAMESLDEYVDAAMEDEKRNAALTGA